MTFEEYLQAAIKQLELIEEATRDHYDECTEMCTHCAMYVLIPASIATINAALASEESGICDDPNCINTIAYEIAKNTFEQIEKRQPQEQES